MHLQRRGGADASHANRAALHRSQMVAGLKLPQAYRDGLRSCYWPGRAQVAHSPCMCAWPSRAAELEQC